MREPCTCAPHFICPACRAWAPQRRSVPRARGPIVLNRTIVANALKAFRRRERLTIREAAAQLNLGYTTVVELEHRRVFTPSVKTVQVLHTRLGIPKGQLFLKRQD